MQIETQTTDAKLKTLRRICVILGCILSISPLLTKVHADPKCEKRGELCPIDDLPSCGPTNGACITIPGHRRPENGGDEEAHDHCGACEQLNGPCGGDAFP